jgi:hypothetical protein
MILKRIQLIAFVSLIVFAMGFTACEEVIDDDDSTPVITLQPSAGFYTPASPSPAPLTVSATVNDGSSLSYQWFSNDAPIFVGRQLIPGANSDTFVPDVSQPGSKYYQVVVTNAGVDGFWTDSAFTQVTVFPTANLLWDDAPFNVGQWSGNSVDTITTESGTAVIGPYQTTVAGVLNLGGGGYHHIIYTFPATKDFTAAVAPNGSGNATQGTLHASLFLDSGTPNNFVIELHKGTAWGSDQFRVNVADEVSSGNWVDLNIPCSSMIQDGSSDWSQIGILHVYTYGIPEGSTIKIKDLFIY